MFHNKFFTYTSSNAKSKTKPDELLAFERSFEEAIKANPEIDRHMKRVVDDLTPLRALNILKNVPNAEVELLGIDPSKGG